MKFKITFFLFLGIFFITSLIKTMEPKKTILYKNENSNCIKSLDYNPTTKELLIFSTDNKPTTHTESENSCDKITLYSFENKASQDYKCPQNDKFGYCTGAQFNLNGYVKMFHNSTTNFYTLRPEKKDLAFIRKGEKKEIFTPNIASSSDDTKRKAEGLVNGNIKFTIDGKPIRINEKPAQFIGNENESGQNNNLASVTTVKFNKENNLVAAGYSNGTLKVISFPNPTDQQINMVHNWKNTEGSVTAITFGEDNTVIAGFSNGSVIEFDSTSPNEITNNQLIDNTNSKANKNPVQKINHNKNNNIENKLTGSTTEKPLQKDQSSEFKQPDNRQNGSDNLTKSNTLDTGTNQNSQKESKIEQHDNQNSKSDSDKEENNNRAKWNIDMVRTWLINNKLTATYVAIGASIVIYATYLAIANLLKL